MKFLHNISSEELQHKEGTDYMDGNEVGEPQPADGKSIEELKAMGIVGIYRKDNENDK